MSLQVNKQNQSQRHADSNGKHCSGEVAGIVDRGVMLSHRAAPECTMSARILVRADREGVVSEVIAHLFLHHIFDVDLLLYLLF